MAAAVIRLDDRRARRSVTLPTFRLAESGMEIGEAGRAIHEGLLTLSQGAWQRQDIAALRVIQRLVRTSAAVEAEGRRVAGWADFDEEGPATA